MGALADYMRKQFPELKGEADADLEAYANAKLPEAVRAVKGQGLKQELKKEQASLRIPEKALYAVGEGAAELGEGIRKVIPNALQLTHYGVSKLSGVPYAPLPLDQPLIDPEAIKQNEFLSQTALNLPGVPEVVASLTAPELLAEIAVTKKLPASRLPLLTKWSGESATALPEMASEAGRLSVEGTPNELATSLVGGGVSALVAAAPGLLGKKAATAEMRPDLYAEPVNLGAPLYSGVHRRVRDAGANTPEAVQALFPELPIESARMLRDASFPELVEPAKPPPLPESAKQAVTEPTKGVSDASPKPEAAEVHGDVPAQPVKGQKEVPVEVGGEGVRPQAEALIADLKSVGLSEDIATALSKNELTVEQAVDMQLRKFSDTGEATIKKPADMSHGEAIKAAQEQGRADVAAVLEKHKAKPVDERAPEGEAVKEQPKAEEPKPAEAERPPEAVELAETAAENRIPVAKPGEAVPETPPAAEQAPVSTPTAPQTGEPATAWRASRIQPLQPGQIRMTNKAIDADRKARGLEPLAEVMHRSWPKEAARAEAELNADPDLAIRLVAEINREPRPVTAWETVALYMHKMHVKNKYDMALKDHLDAKARGLDDAAKAAIRDMDRTAMEENNVDMALGQGGIGTEAGRAFAIRQAFLKDDWSIDKMMRQRRMGMPEKERGRQLTKTEENEVKAVHAKIKRLSSELEVEEGAAVKKRALTELEKLLESKRKPSVKDVEEKPRTPLTLNEIENLSKELETKLAEAIIMRKDNVLSVLVRRLANDLVEFRGVREADDLLNIMHGIMKKFDDTLSIHDVSDAFTGYGRYRPLTANAVQGILADLRGQLLQKSKIRSLKELFEPAKRTGQQPRPRSNKERKLIKEYNEARREFQIEIDSPASQLMSALDSFIERTKNAIADYEARLKAGDFELHKKRKPIELNDRARALNDRLIEVRNDWIKARHAEQVANMKLGEKAWHKTQELTGLLRSWQTSFDHSAVLRQGKLMGVAHPLIAVKAFKESIKALRSEEYRRKVDYEIMHRENAPLYRQSGLYLAERNIDLSKRPEEYRSTLGENWWGIAFSERSYSTYLNVMRADLFDSLAARLVSKTEVSPAEYKAIASFINSATGRGSLELLNKNSAALSFIFFSPRFVVSRFEMLSGKGMFYGGTKATKQLIATEYAKIIGGLIVYYSAIMGATAASGGEVRIGTDIYSTDFWKVITGDVRHDPMAGIIQSIVFLARNIRGRYSDTSGNLYIVRGEEKEWAPSDLLDLNTKFTINKFSPVMATATKAVTGVDAGGFEDVTPYSLLKDVLFPMTVRDLYNTLRNQGISSKLSTMTFQALGDNINDYADEEEF